MCKDFFFYLIFQLWFLHLNSKVWLLFLHFFSISLSLFLAYFIDPTWSVPELSAHWCFQARVLPNTPQWQKQIFAQGPWRDGGERFLYINQTTGLNIPNLALGQFFIQGALKEQERLTWKKGTEFHETALEKNSAISTATLKISQFYHLPCKPKGNLVGSQSPCQDGLPKLKAQQVMLPKSKTKPTTHLKNGPNTCIYLSLNQIFREQKAPLKWSPSVINR